MTDEARTDGEKFDTNVRPRIGYVDTQAENEGLSSSSATDGDSSPDQPMWKNHGGGKLQDEIPVPIPVVRVLEEAIGDLNVGRYLPVLQHGMAHVWHCQTRHAHRYDGGVPISYRLWRGACIEKNLPVPGATKQIWERAEQADLLHASGYTYGGENPQSRDFLIAGDLCFQLMNALDNGSEHRTRYNLVNGCRLYGSCSTQTTYDGTHSWKDRSEFIYDVLDTLKGQRDLVNRAAVDAHLDDMAKQIMSADTAYGGAGEWLGRKKKEHLGEGTTPSEEGEQILADAREFAHEQRRNFERQRQRYYQDRRIWDDIVSQGLVEATDQPNGIFEYETAYRVQEASGRLTMTCGLQNASTRMKAVAAEGIGAYHNYDIISSQTQALIMELERAADRGADVDTSILVEYEEAGGKDGLEAFTGIDCERVKIPEHAVKFGAKFNDSLKSAKGIAVGQIAQKIEDEDGNFQFEKLHAFKHESGKAVWERAVLNRLPTMANIAHKWADDPQIHYSDPKEVYGILKNAFAAMAKELEKWRQWLIDEYWPEASQSGGQGQGAFVKNPCDLAFSIHDPRLADGDRDDPNRYEKKSGFATSLLQGREAAFIHALILVQGSYDYEVLRHEHDGAVVIREIPDEAVQEAKEISGFHRAELKCKVFDA